MDTQLILGFLMVIFPIAGLRVGIPVLIDYAIKNDVSNLIPVLFICAILLSFTIAMLIYFFLEFLHIHFMKIRFYQKIFNKFVEKIRKKHEKFEKRYNDLGYVALLIFVSIPVPGSGAWAATFLAWLLGLEKKKAIPIIAMGLLIYGLIVLSLTLGFFQVFYK